MSVFYNNVGVEYWFDTEIEFCMWLISNIDMYYIGRQWLEYPRLWRITMIYQHIEGIYKWVNSAPIFVWYKLLRTTSGPQ